MPRKTTRCSRCHRSLRSLIIVQSRKAHERLSFGRTGLLTVINNLRPGARRGAVAVVRQTS